MIRNGGKGTWRRYVCWLRSDHGLGPPRRMIVADPLRRYDIVCGRCGRILASHRP